VFDFTIFGSAVISPDLLYRYELTRTWEIRLPILNWIMLNPSTADALKDDPTIRRCIAFSHSWRYGGIRVYNLFAFRATQPRELKGWVDPVGPENDSYLSKLTGEDAIVAAWGSHGSAFPDRVYRVCSILKGKKVFVLGRTKGNQPSHPLMLASATPLKKWEEVFH
jgi:hypothetical protein